MNPQSEKTNHLRDPQYGPEIKAAYEACATFKEDVIVTYGELARVIGYDPQASPGYGILSKARKQVEQEKGFKIVAVPGLGLKRLTAADTLKAAKAQRQVVHRANKKGLDILRCVDQTNLSKEQIAEVNGHACSFAAGRHISHGNQVKGIVNKCGQMAAQLPLQATLDYFKSR